MMETVPPSWLSIAWLPVAVLALLLPGWLISRLCQSPAPWLTAFLASSCLYFNGTLALEALGLPLHIGTVGSMLAFMSLALGLIVLRAKNPLGASVSPGSRARSWERIVWFTPVVLALISIGLHSIVAPLPGYDNGFRWDYLARLILMRESLAGYPAVSDHDFEFYAWCDGIPPLVALLNFWVYASTGSVAPALAAVRPAGEALLIGYVVHRYSRLLWGATAGGPALAVASSSALLLWGIIIGQETGLTALSLVSMMYFLELYHRERTYKLLLWAGVAATMGGLSREYGLSFMLLGAVVLAFRRAGRSAFISFVLPSLLLVSPWYLRNWVLTGNPIFPQTLGGIFPGNIAHDETMESIREQWGWLRNPSLFIEEISTYLITTTAGIFVFGVVGLLHLPKKDRALTGCNLVLVTALWLWPIPYTAGGWTYSARVLLPALALLAVLSGVIATWSKRVRYLCLASVLLLSIDASRRAWFLPAFATLPPHQISWHAWRSIHEPMQRIGTHPIWDALIMETGTQGIVVDHPANHALITMRGGRAIPLFSPMLFPTFAATTEVDEFIEQLRSNNVRILALSSQEELRLSSYNRRPFWRKFDDRYVPTYRVELLSIYDLQRLQRRQP